jgi:cell fate regulator YaaT (PSP1 superfamily)
MPTRLDANRASSAHGLPPVLNPARPQVSHFGQPPPHLPKHLYLVTFKAARAEFYYVQEGTGLEVNEGDLVIVEADRGTDLGTVAHKNVDWSVARELREHYVQEHYNWLMMFSRQGQSAAAVGARPSSAGNQGKSLLTSFGAQGASAEPSAAEIKPKLIKRLAQTHEIHTLREKEGNEAKAKRMCQQKVAEHHLNMEILDAEFQM